MDMNYNLFRAVIIIYFMWFIIHFVLKKLLRAIQSYLLFKVYTCNKLDKIYKFIFEKKHSERNETYIIYLRIKLNTYLSKHKYGNKSSLDVIVTITMTILLTLSMTLYNIQIQNNKDIITTIVKNLKDDFILSVFLITGVYGIRGVFREFIDSKLEYYLMVKNIIDEIEREVKYEHKREEKERLILELQEMKNILKENNKEMSIVEKIANILFKMGK